MDESTTKVNKIIIKSVKWATQQVGRVYYQSKQSHFQVHKMNDSTKWMSLLKVYKVKSTKWMTPQNKLIKTKLFHNDGLIHIKVDRSTKKGS